MNKAKYVSVLTLTTLCISTALAGCGGSSGTTAVSQSQAASEAAAESVSAAETSASSPEATSAASGEAELNEIIGADKAEEEIVTGDILTNIPYLEDGNEAHTLDLFGTQESTEPMPGVIEVHGGGYIGGSKEINTEHAAYYRDNGFVVAAPEYSHVGNGISFKDVVQELFASFHFVADHAEEYHFDLDRMFISGDSAGGYYILLCSAIQQSPELQEYFEVEALPFEFKAIIATCPGTDVIALRDSLGAEGPSGHIADTIGEEILNDEELMSHLDLYSIIDPETYPYVYIVTTPDDTTTGAETLQFEEYLTEKGIAHELHSYESQGSRMKHVFNIINMEYPESEQANADIIAFMNQKLQ